MLSYDRHVRSDKFSRGQAGRQDMTFLLTPTCIRLNAHTMAVSKILPDSPATCAACLRVEEVAGEGKAVGADLEQTK